MSYIETAFESAPFNRFSVTKEELEILSEFEQDGELHWNNLVQHRPCLNKVRQKILSIIEGDGWVTLHD